MILGDEMYRTKTQKKNALKSVRSKAMKLYMGGAISMRDAENISKICDMRLKKL
tara:strand:+ start:48 stop:209 length:162 start_codon:yes stop_codon:yes gene_type:complete